MARLPTKKSALEFIRASSLEIGSIIDVGVQGVTAELHEVYPDRKHLLFEPVVEFHPRIRENYQGFDYELIGAAVSDQTGSSVLSLRRATGDLITHSQVGIQGEESREIELVRLDDIVPERNCQKPYLLKIDVDGHEMQVLKGGAETLKDAACVVIEAPLPCLQQRMNFLCNHGFVLWDIVDLCYYYDTLWQVDLVFLSEEAYANTEALNPRKFYELDVSRYLPFKPEA